MVTTWQAIYLGNTGLLDVDPTERNSVSENADRLAGQTYGSAANPLFNNIVTMSAIDQRGTAAYLDTARGTGQRQDLVRYDLGAGTRTTVFEGGGVYEAEITFQNGSTGKVSAIVFQDEARNLFLAPELSANADSSIYNSGPIRSITLERLTVNNGNLTTNRNAADFVTCFAAGTLIQTPDGLRPVEDLRAGDLVQTWDHGPQMLRWTGSRRIACRDDHLRPIRIRAGALGQDLPIADLLVSPQHRVLARSAIARRMFGADEVLVAAKHLVALPGIDVAEEITEISYVHLLFDRHQLVLSNGAITESLFTGPEALKGVSKAARDEIIELFPDLAEIGADLELPEPVRPLIGGRQGRQFAQRHLANVKPVVAAR